MNKRESINYNHLPLKVYPRYSPVAFLMYFCSNFVSIALFKMMFLTSSNYDLLFWIFIIYNSVVIFATIYYDVDFIHSISKIQYIEITKEYIAIKKLRKYKKFNWRDIKKIEPLYSVKSKILIGVKIEHVTNKKSKFFWNTNVITINFNKYDCLDIEEFIELINRRFTSRYMIRF